MGAPLYFLHAPALDDPPQNYDDECAAFSRFLARPAKRPLSVLTESSRIGRQFVRWRLDEDLSGRDGHTEVGWIMLGAEHGRAGLVRDALDVAVATWARHTFVDGVASRLLHQTTEDLSIRAVIDDLRRRFGSSYASPLVLVVDGALGMAPDELAAIGVYELFEALNEDSGRRSFHGIVLARTPASNEGTAVAPEPAIRVGRIGGPIHGRPAPEQTDAPAELEPASRDLLRRIHGVDIKAEREVVRYFQCYSKSSVSDLRLLNRTNVLQALNDSDAVCLGDAAQPVLARLRDADTLALDASFDTAEIGAKIISIYPLATLAPSVRHQLNELRVCGDEILDQFAHLFAGKVLNDVQGVRNLVDRFRAHRSQLPAAIDGENLARMRLLLSYGSQAALIDTSPFAAYLFDALEPITQAYAEAVSRVVPDSSEATAMAARAHYNLGYVYDRMAEQPRRQVSVQRNVFAQRATEVFRGAWFEQDLTSLRRRFHYAWYLYDVDDAQGAACEMAQVGELRWRVAMRTSQDAASLATAELECLECAFIAVAMAPDARLPDVLNGLADEFLAASGVFPGLRTLRQWLSDDDRVPGPAGPVYSSRVPARRLACLHFNRFDLFAAIVTGRRLHDEFGYGVRYVPVDRRDEYGAKAPETPQFALPGRKNRRLDVILGAPDSPEPIGRNIADLDPLFGRLYQANITADFADPLPAQEEEPLVVVMAGSGMGTPQAAWRLALEKNLFPMAGEDSLMLDSFDPSLLSELFRSARDATINSVVNQVIDKVRSRIQRRGGEVEKQDLEKLRANLLKTAKQAREGSVDKQQIFETLDLDSFATTQRREILEALQPDQISEIVLDVAKEVRGLSAEPERLRDLAHLLAQMSGIYEDQTENIKQQEVFQDLTRNFRRINAAFERVLQRYRNGEDFDEDTYERNYDSFRRALTSFERQLQE